MTTVQKVCGEVLLNSVLKIIEAEIPARLYDKKRVLILIPDVPRGLFAVLDALLFCLVNGLPLFDAGVIETAVGFKHDGKLTFLVAVSPETIFVGANHDNKIIYFIKLHKLRKKEGGDSPVT
jgi:hypothetical protein